MGIKQFSKAPGYSIAVGEKYICLVGRSITIFDRSTKQMVCKFSDMRNYSSAIFFSDDILVAKNTGGKYKFYDIKESTCIETYENRKIASWGQDGRFAIDVSSKILYDIVMFPDFKPRLLTLNLKEKQWEFEYLPYTGHVEISTDFRDGFRFVQDMRRDKDGASVFSPMLVTYRDEKFSRYSIQAGESGHCFFGGDFVIFSNGEVFWTGSNTVQKLNLPSDAKYINSASFYAEKNWLGLQYPEVIYLVDCSRNEVFYEYRDRFASAVQIIDNHLFIGTWKKTMWYENFVDEMSAQYPNVLQKE